MDYKLTVTRIPRNGERPTITRCKGTLIQMFVNFDIGLDKLRKCLALFGGCMNVNERSALYSDAYDIITIELEKV